MKIDPTYSLFMKNGGSVKASISNFSNITHRLPSADPHSSVVLEAVLPQFLHRTTQSDISSSIDPGRNLRIDLCAPGFYFLDFLLYLSPHYTLFLIYP